MKTKEWMNLVSLQIKELSDAIDDREKVMKQLASGVPYWKVDIPPHAKKEAIKRRVKQIRQDLMGIAKEVDG